MISFVLRRLLQSLVVVLVLSMVLFVGLWLIGNPVDAMISSEATEADRLAAMKALGLDRPVVPVSTLAVLAAPVAAGRIIAAIDARDPPSPSSWRPMDCSR